MSEFKKKVQSIIEDYCEGINHLEFSIDNFPEMLDRIETEALRIHDVVGQSEQLPCQHCGQLEPCAGNSPETCYHPKAC